MRVSTRFDSAPARTFAALAVITLHIVVIHVLDRVRHGVRKIDARIDDSMALRFIPTTVEPLPSIARPTARVSRGAPRPEAAAATRPPLDVEPAQTHKTGVDWRANAARSAQAAVEEAARTRYRTFGPRQDAPKDEAPAPSMFAEEKRHARGEVGVSASGDPVVWINENCYTTLDKAVQTARDWVISNPGSSAPASINCVGGENGSFRLVMPNPSSFTPPSLNYSIAIGRKEPNGKLFEHIKKKTEPAVPKAGTEMSPLPRKIETGEVFER